MSAAATVGAFLLALAATLGASGAILLVSAQIHGEEILPDVPRVGRGWLPVWLVFFVQNCGDLTVLGPVQPQLVPVAGSLERACPSPQRGLD